MIAKTSPGDVFGDWTVLSLGSARPGSIKMWVCICVCGTQKLIRQASLRDGSSTSCGCLAVSKAKVKNTKHGLSESPEYRTWKSIKQRCLNPKTRHYKDYGGRGIAVCDRWLNSFEDFLADMGKKPSPKHEIDRYPDNDGNYGPGNCRWASRSQQMSNTRRVPLITANGLTLSSKEWADRTGLKQETIMARINRFGWDKERAVTIGAKS